MFWNIIIKIKSSLNFQLWALLADSKINEMKKESGIEMGKKRREKERKSRRDKQRKKNRETKSNREKHQITYCKGLNSFLKVC